MTALPPPIPSSTAKEWVSLSYVVGLCAQAQLNISHYGWDDGFDLQIGSTKAMVPGHDPGSLFISVQLKARTGLVPKDGYLSLRLDVQTYNRLRNADAVHDQYLIVYRMPREQTSWIRHEGDCTEFHHAAYFLSLRGRQAPPKGQKHVTVKIPEQNRLTADALKGCVKKEFQKWLPKKAG